MNSFERSVSVDEDKKVTVTYTEKGKRPRTESKYLEDSVLSEEDKKRGVKKFIDLETNTEYEKYSTFRDIEDAQTEGLEEKRNKKGNRIYKSEYTIKIIPPSFFTRMTRRMTGRGKTRRNRRKQTRRY